MCKKKSGEILAETLLGVFVVALVFMAVHAAIDVAVTNIQYSRDRMETQGVCTSVCDALQSTRFEPNNEIKTILQMEYTNYGINKSVVYDDTKLNSLAGAAFADCGNDVLLDGRYDISVEVMYGNKNVYRDYMSPADSLGSIDIKDWTFLGIKYSLPSTNSEVSLSQIGLNAGLIPVKVTVKKARVDWESYYGGTKRNSATASSCILLFNKYDFS